MADPATHTVGVLLGNGGGTFQPGQTYPAGTTPVSVVSVTSPSGTSLAVVLGETADLKEFVFGRERAARSAYASRNPRRSLHRVGGTERAVRGSPLLTRSERTIVPMLLLLQAVAQKIAPIYVTVQAPPGTPEWVKILLNAILPTCGTRTSIGWILD